MSSLVKSIVLQRDHTISILAWLKFTNCATFYTKLRPDRFWRSCHVVERWMWWLSTNNHQAPVGHGYGCGRLWELQYSRGMVSVIWMPRVLTDDKSTLVQVMAWCRQATSHYLSQCWPRFMSPYGVTSEICFVEICFLVVMSCIGSRMNWL